MAYEPTATDQNHPPTTPREPSRPTRGNGRSPENEDRRTPVKPVHQVTMSGLVKNDPGDLVPVGLDLAARMAEDECMNTTPDYYTIQPDGTVTHDDPAAPPMHIPPPSSPDDDCTVAEVSGVGSVWHITMNPAVMRFEVFVTSGPVQRRAMVTADAGSADFAAAMAYVSANVTKELADEGL